MSSLKRINCLCYIYLHCRDDFVTGDPNFNQEMDSMRSKAEQQGTAQPELRDVAKDIKKVLLPNSLHEDLACFRTQDSVGGCACTTRKRLWPCLHAQLLTSIVPLCRTFQASTQRQHQTVPLEAGTERHVSGPES